MVTGWKRKKIVTMYFCCITIFIWQHICIYVLHLCSWNDLKVGLWGAHCWFSGSPEDSLCVCDCHTSCKIFYVYMKIFHILVWSFIWTKFFVHPVLIYSTYMTTLVHYLIEVSNILPNISSPNFWNYIHNANLERPLITVNPIDT